MENKTLWIARDKNGELFLYLEKPGKADEHFFIKDDEEFNPFRALELPVSDYPSVTWENSPQQVELKLKEGNG